LESVYIIIIDFIRSATSVTTKQNTRQDFQGGDEDYNESSDDEDGIILNLLLFVDLVKNGL
jgi:hypothetical protein